MSLFDIFDTVASAVIENKINSYVDRRISAGVSMAMRFFSRFVLLFCIFIILSTVLFIIPFAVTHVIASVMVLVISLVATIAFIVLIIKAIPRIIELSTLWKGRYSNTIIYHGTSTAIDELADNLPGIIVRILIMAAVFAICLFIMRMTVLGSVEKTGFFKLLVFPFTLSFDTIFRTNMSEALFGPF